MGILPCFFFRNFYKGGQLLLLFASLSNETFPKGIILKEKKCSKRSKFYPFRVDPIQKRGKPKLEELLALKEYPFALSLVNRHIDHDSMTLFFFFFFLLYNLTRIRILCIQTGKTDQTVQLHRLIMSQQRRQDAH